MNHKFKIDRIVVEFQTI